MTQLVSWLRLTELDCVNLSDMAERIAQAEADGSVVEPRRYPGYPTWPLPRVGSVGGRVSMTHWPRVAARGGSALRFRTRGRWADCCKRRTGSRGTIFAAQFRRPVDCKHWNCTSCIGKPAGCRAACTTTTERDIICRNLHLTQTPIVGGNSSRHCIKLKEACCCGC